MVVSDGRFMDDHRSLEAIVAQMPDGERRDYQAFKALSLEAAFPNRRMVVYTVRYGEPFRISSLLFGDMEMTRTGGPTITVTDEGGPLHVTVLPRKWRDRDLFLHVPQNFVFKWKGKDTGASGVKFVPHCAILIKTRSKEHLQVEGDTYCVTLNNFRERFPDVPIRY
jgi:hypothetical protein